MPDIECTNCHKEFDYDYLEQDEQVEGNCPHCEKNLLITGDYIPSYSVQLNNNFCDCSFVMIMRDPEGNPICSECKKLVDEIPTLDPKK